MIISFTLNNEDVQVDTEPAKRVSHVLREDFKLLETKTGCLDGSCGTCSILMDEEIVLSCLIPAFVLKGRSIITLEGFSQTDEYKDIIQGFREAKYYPCSYCKGGKILVIHALLRTLPVPTEQDILDSLIGNTCRCDDIHSLIKGVKYAAFAREARTHGKKS